MSVHPFRRLAAVAAAVLLLATGAGPSSATPQPTPQPRYVNPVSASFADTFADPSIIEAKDGWWYAYSTADPLRSGDEPGIMHIARTRDFTGWEYLGTVFDDTNRPTWASPDAGLWAPDVRYIDGRYVIYFTVTDTTLDPGDADSAIGVATSPTPVGPWTPSGAPVVGPRTRPGTDPAARDFLWTFDPSGFTDVDGRRYLYFGSYNGGVWVTRVSSDGLTATGEPEQVAIDNKFEGSYVTRHGEYYYLMASSANCCAGPATGYSVFSGRSRSPLGPFVDADGIPLLASKAGGTILVTQNGNRWIGAGHHAIATDHAGRDWLVYHAMDRDNAWLTEPEPDPEDFPITRRPMLIDSIDWVGGWPRARAGAGPSDSRQPAPVTGTDLGIDSADPARSGFVGLVAGSPDAQAGRTAQLTGTARTRRDVRGNTVRVRLDFRGDQPLQLQLGDGRRRVVATVDPSAGRLQLSSGQRSAAAPLRLAGEGWHSLVLETGRNGTLVQLSEDDLNDPFAELRLLRGSGDVAGSPLVLRSPDVSVDNISIRPLAEDARQLVPVPQTRGLIRSEEFRGALSDDWRWVRRDTDATVAGGHLDWPVQSADLVGTGNDAAVLVNDGTPNGNWIAETKLRLDLGENEVRNFQQAGLIAYENDDDFARLSSVAIWNTRQTEYGRELDAGAPDGRTIYGGAIVGTPDATVWLRLAHTRNRAGEHLYRAGTSRDGRNWTWGAVWTFDADTDPEIGLVAHGGENPPVVARFDYLRFYRSTWTGPTG